MTKRFFLIKSFHAILLLGAALAVRADDIKLDWQSPGVSKKLGYRPQRLILSADKPDGIKAVPGDLAAPLYGKFRLGPAEAPTTIFVIVVEPEGKSCLPVMMHQRFDLAVVKFANPFQ